MADTDDHSIQGGVSWRIRATLIALFLAAVGVIYVTNDLLTERFTNATRSRAAVRLALYSGNLMSELQRSSVVPLLLSRDPTLIGALNSTDYSQSSQRLITYAEEIGAASLLLLDNGGRVVASSDRNRIGANQQTEAYFVDARRSNDTVFIAGESASGGYSFTYSRKITSDRETIGVIVVAVDLAKFEQSWSGISDAVMVTNSEGLIILSTEPRWRGRTVDEALATQSAPSAIQRAIQATRRLGRAAREYVPVG